MKPFELHHLNLFANIPNIISFTSLAHFNWSNIFRNVIRHLQWQRLIPFFKHGEFLLDILNTLVRPRLHDDALIHKHGINWQSIGFLFIFCRIIFLAIRLQRHVMRSINWLVPMVIYLVLRRIWSSLFFIQTNFGWWSVRRSDEHLLFKP